MTDSVYATAPFDHAKADIILRSADNIDFRVFTLFLSLASPFFNTLFELPRPTDVGEDQGVKDGLVVVPIAENSKILDTLLRFCYPCTLAEDPELEVLKDAMDVLEAARKYSLDAIEKKALQAIINPKILKVEPLRCYVIAHQGRLREEALLAAKYTLTQPLIPTWFQEIERITAADLLSLLTYHKRCGDAVYALRADPSWVKSHYRSHTAGRWFLGQYTRANTFDNTTSTTPGCSRCQRSTTSYRLFNCQPMQWWERFMEEVFMELRDKPCEVTVRAAAEKTIQTVKGLDCDVCPATITEGMRDFSDLLVRKVDEVVAQIDLNLNF